MRMVSLTGYYFLVALQLPTSNRAAQLRALRGAAQSAGRLWRHVPQPEVG
jgi:hypothetical protein